MERLRVAIFSDSAAPILNGVSVSISWLISELRDRGHSVHLFTAASPGYRDPDPNTYRFRAMETPWTRRYPLAFPPFYRMLLKFRRQEFDVIHTHTPFTIGFVGLRWAESHDLPIVSTYHTLYDRYAHYIPFFPRRYVRFRIAKHTNFYYNNVDQIITPSEAAAKWLRRHSVERPIHVIPTGIPAGPIFDRSEARIGFGMHPEAKVLLYVGRLAKEKNLEFLFDSVALAMKADRRLELWLVGEGPYRETIVAYARRLGIGDKVRFVGQKSRAEVDRYYAAADLFVFSSVTETQGLVVLEAMSYGLPAVVVAGGGASEPILEARNGYAVAPEAHAFSEAIERALGTDSAYARLSAGANETARRYRAESSADRVVQVYRAAIESHERFDRRALERVW